MKTIFSALAGMGAIGMILAVVLLILGPIGLTVYGLYLAFKASVLLGIIVLLVEPTPFILGVCALFGHPDIAQRIATWLGI